MAEERRGRRASKDADRVPDTEYEAGAMGRVYSLHSSASSYPRSIPSKSSTSGWSRPGDAGGAPPAEAVAAAEEEELPCWVDPAEDMVGFLFYHKLYKCGDPFESLTSTWLETGMKGLEDTDEPQGDTEQNPADAAAAAEKKREEERPWKDPLKGHLEGNGHLLWMRGRDLRAELVDQVEKRKTELARVASTATSTGSVNVHPLESAHLEDGLHWFMAPKMPRSAEERSSQQVKGERAVWFWRSDFVEEALHAAVGLGMVLPVVDAYSARRALRKNPEVAQALRGHVAVTSTDRQCQLWSPNFLQSLGVLREVWDFGDEVRLEKHEVKRMYPSALDSILSAQSQQQSPQALRMPVPALLLRERGPPPAPQMPDRLPSRAAYDVQHLRSTRTRRSSVGSMASDFGRVQSMRSTGGAMRATASAARMSLEPSGRGSAPTGRNVVRPGTLKVQKTVSFT